MVDGLLLYSRQRSAGLRNEDSMARDHIVPQLLLRGFTDPATGRVCVYDKKTDKVFWSGTSGIAAEHDYYDFKVMGGRFTIDSGLTKLESETDPILKKIILTRSIAALSIQERMVVSHFAAVQMLRGQVVRDGILTLNQTMANMFRERGYDPTKIKNFGVMNKEDARLVSLRLVTEASREFAAHIYSKTWLLFQTSPPETFWISDNPVVMNNDVYPPVQGGLGLAAPGVQISLPITAELSLGFYCPSIALQVRKDHLRLRALSLLSPREAARRFLDPLFSESLMRGFDEGRTVPIPGTSVVHHNSLQVAFCARFVYSPNDRFRLVQRMISDDDRYRQAPLPLITWPASRKRPVGGRGSQGG